jgi:hypothetical protein
VNRVNQLAWPGVNQSKKPNVNRTMKQRFLTERRRHRNPD